MESLNFPFSLFPPASTCANQLRLSVNGKRTFLSEENYVGFFSFLVPIPWISRKDETKQADVCWSGSVCMGNMTNGRIWSLASWGLGLAEWGGRDGTWVEGAVSFNLIQ